MQKHYDYDYDYDYDGKNKIYAPSFRLSESKCNFSDKLNDVTFHRNFRYIGNYLVLTVILTKYHVDHKDLKL